MPLKSFRVNCHFDKFRQGNTPLIELKSLSKLTGCRIFVKAESLNPGGSVKDRASKWMVEKAEREGLLKPGGTIVEGTGGN